MLFLLWPLVLKHFSAPHDCSSINDYTVSDLFTLTTTQWDDVYAIINSLGTGALMSKILFLAPPA